MSEYTFNTAGPDGIRVWDVGSSGRDVVIDTNDSTSGSSIKDSIVVDRHQIPWLIDALNRWMAATDSLAAAVQF